MQRFGSFELHLPAVDVKILLLRDVRLLVRADLDVFPNLDPARGQFLADVAEIASEKLDAIAQGAGCVAVLQIAGILLLHVVVTALDAADVDGLAASTLLILKNQYRAMPAQYIDQLQPILKPLVRYRFVVLTGVVHQQIQRAVGEKELVRGVVDLLAPKVPYV